MVGLCKGLGILTVEGADRGPERRACLQDRSATAFFILLVIIALPVWLVSGRLGVISALRIPTSDLALAFSPLVAAFAITAGREGWRAATKLLARAVDPTSMRGGRWNAGVVLIPPAVYATSWGVMRLVGSGAAMPPFHPLRLALLLGLFLVLAAGEEVGWMGYAFEPLQRRWGALPASSIIAVPWWLGHLPSMAEIGATHADMAWWALGALGLRIVMAWLYNNTGASLFAMVLFHALLNLSRIATFPVVGSHYVTAYQAAAYLAIASLAVVAMITTRGRLGHDHA
jgi:membrane protease YdiL (CAAX protease family)